MSQCTLSLTQEEDPNSLKSLQVTNSIRSWILQRLSRASSDKSGFSLVEVLVGITILSVLGSMMMPMLILSFNATEAARDYSALTGEAEALISEYRQKSFNDVLQEMLTVDVTTVNAIPDEHTVTINHSSESDTSSSLVLTLEAVKDELNGMPHAVKIRVDISQNRNLLGDTSFSYETIITEYF